MQKMDGLWDTDTNHFMAILVAVNAEREDKSLKTRNKGAVARYNGRNGVAIFWFHDVASSWRRFQILVMYAEDVFWCCGGGFAVIWYEFDNMRQQNLSV